MLGGIWAERPQVAQLIVHEGVPYGLTRLEPGKNYDPCRLCDLREVCLHGEVVMSLLPLCQPEGLDAGWYFEVNWNLLDKKVADFI